MAIMLGTLLQGCSAQEETKVTPEKQTETTPTPAAQSETKEVTKHEEEKHWSYSGDTSPEHWGELSPDNKVCVDGKEQSPINLTSGKEEKNSLAFFYQPLKFTLANNGHTEQLNPVARNNYIELDGDKYTLAQFHFHTPSEHEKDSKPFDMEVHLVHKDDKGELAVVGMLIKEGKENTILSEVWKSLPTEKTEKDIELSQTIDLNALLPKDQKHFEYDGSLTTPPCSENVDWIVMDTPIEMSKEQIDKFRKLFPDNHRPVQPLNTREITIKK